MDSELLLKLSEEHKKKYLLELDKLQMKLKFSNMDKSKVIEKKKKGRPLKKRDHKNEY
jgi:hypothetical protein